MAIIDIHPIRESDWIADTTPHQDEVGVDRVGDFSVVFARTVAASSILGAVKIVGPDGDIVEGAFDPIDLSNDYNSITRRLTMHISTPLEGMTTYALLVEGLYSPTGEGQDVGHYLTFMTNDNDVDLTADAGNIDFINVLDNTDISKPLVIIDGEVTVSTVALVRTLPTNGSYNISPAYNAGEMQIVFSEAVGDVDETHVLVEKRVISTIETSHDIVAVEVVKDSGNPKQVNITLPMISEGVYIEPGYEYRITVFPTLPMLVDDGTYGATSTVTFCGKLEPMMSSVQSVLMNYPGVSSYEVAMMIFYSSMEVLDVKPSMDITRPSKAASEYVLYSTLARFADLSGGGEEIQSITLGDLTIDHGSGGTSLSSKWRALADRAWARLIGSGGGQKVGIKGGSNVSPFVNRDWNKT